MSYLSLLIRERADLRDTKEEWRQDIALADQWLQKAMRRKRLEAEPASHRKLAKAPLWLACRSTALP
jgi:parvulin-like peptidyl-prolyl isomerase